MSVSDTIGDRLASRPGQHVSFLVYNRYRYLKVAAIIAVISIVLYVVDQPYGPPYGGSWAGYTLGTVGALLIFWLTWFGYRKRRYDEGPGMLASRLSAHVYLGLVLIIVATLHTGFQFHWNLHTLAYVLMCIVIASGVFGIVFYSRYPRLMTENRRNMTRRQMLSALVALDDQLRREARPLDDKSATLVERAIERTALGGSTWRQLSGRYSDCPTAAAITGFDASEADAPAELEDVRRRVRVLLDQKAALLEQVRRDMSYKAMMDIWLYVHVPFTFALLAALIAHIISVFFLF
jgi:hypothetical protein